jgi:hypothetical protein
MSEDDPKVIAFEIWVEHDFFHLSNKSNIKFS